MYARGLRACPRKILKIVCFEIDFDGIFYIQEQSSFYQSIEF